MHIYHLATYSIHLQVQYNAVNFLEKNRDRLSSNLKACMENSDLEFIKDLFAAELTEVGQIDKCVSSITR